VSEVRDDAGSFIAMLVHDLKNPLAAIVGNAEFLALAPELSPESREAVGDISAGALMLGRIGSELVEIGRGLRGELAPQRARTDVAELLRDVVAAVGTRAERAGVPVVLDVDPPALAAPIDEEMIRHVVENLVDNALRRAPGRTRVTIRARGMGTGATIAVEDASPPPAAPLDKLFSGEATGEGVRIGRRLGLLHARLVCECHGGSIRAESPAEGGLRVVIELPASSTPG
jgi:signal transduction histidine kinase